MTNVRRTRDALLRSALELFEERGYDATSAAAIAQRAGVSEMTFFRYFPTKDAVLLADPYDPLITHAIVRQPRSYAPLVAAISGVADAWQSVPPPASSEVRTRLRIVSQTPSLTGALARNSVATERAMREALAQRGASDAEARIAAAATMGALNAALLHWADGNDPDLGTAISAAVHVLNG
jgi:AcrR family transcriptional regulator